jgi:hypothetical protein
MFVRAEELFRVMRRAGVHAIGVAVDRDRWNGDRRLRREPGLDRSIGGIAGDEPVAMPVGVDDDLDEVVIVESARGALKRRLVERPGRRPHPPEQAGDGAPVLRQAAPAALAMEIILVPQRRLLRRTRRLHGARDVLDVVGIARDERLRAPGPQRRDHAGGPSAPVVAAKDRPLDLKRVHQRQKIRAERRLLARARRLGSEKPR